MNKQQLIFELVAMLTICGLFIWGFASGPAHSWGWHAIVYFGEFLQNRGA